MAIEYDPPLNPGIRNFVHVLAKGGVETFESCEGGSGHAYTEPTIRFHGDRSAGFRALALALEHDLPVAALRRTWPILDGEPTGPWWEMTFQIVHRSTNDHGWIDCDDLAGSVVIVPGPLG